MAAQVEVPSISNMDNHILQKHMVKRHKSADLALRGGIAEVARAVHNAEHRLHPERFDHTHRNQLEET